MEGKNFEQLTLEDILNISDDAKNELSIKDLKDIIEELDRLSVVARKRHALEQKRLEREERERKAREEQERNDAHIREVTCMDLPMDWENAFNSDDRTRGVHAQTPSDALIKAELENRESYSDRIEQLNEQIASIDKELGVDRK